MRGMSTAIMKIPRCFSQLLFLIPSAVLAGEKTTDAPAVAKAAAEAARVTGQPKQALYRRLMQLKEGGG